MKLNFHKNITKTKNIESEDKSFQKVLVRLMHFNTCMVFILNLSHCPVALASRKICKMKQGRIAR